MFTDAERQQLGKAIAATNATANLLGRARIRLRMQAATKHYESAAGPVKFSDQLTDFSVFDDTVPLKPIEPAKAVAYFKRLLPSLTPPERFGPAMERTGFTLAGVTDKTLLGNVQDAIRSRLETGKDISSAPSVIDELLEAAGVSPKNADYASMVFRTNMMDAYNTGSTEELQDPDVADYFPVWKYSGIRDGRQRPEHEVHFDHYFPNGVAFTEVRDSVKVSPFNCRCVPVPIDRYEWAELKKGGATISAFTERAARRLLLGTLSVSGSRLFE